VPEKSTKAERFISIRMAKEGHLAWLSLNRPEKLNAISPRMISELNTALDELEADEQIRVIILKGEGKAFSSGFDLEGSDDQAGPESELGSGSKSLSAMGAMRQELQNDFDIIMRFWDSPKPTIAAVHKYCIGGAIELAAACDITLAEEGCRFGAPEVRFGSGIVAMLYPWFCGPKRAKELLLTGNDRMSAAQALEWGLINRIEPGDQLFASAAELGREIARNDPLAVRLTKLAINRSCEAGGMRTALDQALELDVVIEGTETEESRQFNEILKTEGARAATAWRNRNSS
jgi:enoyl-CoA hydratase